MLSLRFTPAADSTNEPLELGPFSSIHVERNDLFADGEPIAFIFVEGALEMHDPANMFGHPDAGKWVIYETERLYGRCEFKAVAS